MKIKQRINAAIRSLHRWVRRTFTRRVPFYGHGGRLMYGWVLSKNADGTTTYDMGRHRLLERWPSPPNDERSDPAQTKL